MFKNKVVTFVEIYCDVCEKYLGQSEKDGGVHKCAICGKHLCLSCCGYINFDPKTGKSLGKIDCPGSNDDGWDHKLTICGNPQSKCSIYAGEFVAQKRAIEQKAQRELDDLKHRFFDSENK